MNVPLERTTKVVSAKRAQKGRIRIKQPRQAVKPALQEHLQRKDLMLVDVSDVCILQGMEVR